MLFSSRALVAALVATRVKAVVFHRTISTPLYITTAVENILPRQESATPVPSPGASALSGPELLPSTGSVNSTHLITTTWATTQIITQTTATEPDDVIPVPGNTTWVEWLVTSATTSTSITTTLQTCIETATCTGANWTKGENGTLVIPIPIPILVIINNVVPQQGKPNNNNNNKDPKKSKENQKSQDDKTTKSKDNKISKSNDEKTSTLSKSVSATGISSISSVSSTAVSGSSKTSSTTSSSFPSSMISSSSLSSLSSFYSSITTTFSSLVSSTTTISSSSSVNSTLSAGPSCPIGSGLEISDDEGDNWWDDESLSCPKGVGLSQDDDEGDNENPDAGTFCPHLSLELNDEEDFELGDWHNFKNSSNIPIPLLSFKPSSTPTQLPVAPTLPHQKTTKPEVAPTLPTSANRPNETPIPGISTEYKCVNIRAYAGPDANEDCKNDEYCKSFEWWGPIGKDPMLRTPLSAGVNNTWNGWERTCEPYKESPDSYYCKSCTRNPQVCKIIRDYNKNNWPSEDKTPIEECWADEMCENDREHTRICHERNPYPRMSDYQDSVFCMECSRNSPVEPDSKGCMAQMDFKNDGRQDFPPYQGKDFHDCKSHCVADDYANRFCLGTECYSCPYKFT